jgi:hypothetical protein
MPKGKKKSVEQKLEDAMNEVAKQYERVEDPAKQKEIEEAVTEISDALAKMSDAPVQIESPKIEKIKVGHHPVTKEAVYL